MDNKKEMGKETERENATDKRTSEKERIVCVYVCVCVDAGNMHV